MSIERIIQRALTEGNCWPAVFAAGSAKAASDAILAALVDAGYAVVPLDPTAEMLMEGRGAGWHGGIQGDIECEEEATAILYRAMLAARPR